MILTENAVLTRAPPAWRSRRAASSTGAAQRFAERASSSASTCARPAPAALARSLSGGNLQKFVVGREIGQTPGVLVVSQPTWGVDAGAAAAIRQALIDLAAKGAAVVVISQDLDELLELADRLASSTTAGSRRRARREGSVDEIGLMMGGVHGEGRAASRPCLNGGAGASRARLML